MLESPRSSTRPNTGFISGKVIDPTLLAYGPRPAIASDAGADASADAGDDAPHAGDEGGSGAGRVPPAEHEDPAAPEHPDDDHVGRNPPGRVGAGRVGGGNRFDAEAGPPEHVGEHARAVRMRFDEQDRRRRHTHYAVSGAPRRVSTAALDSSRASSEAFR